MFYIFISILSALTSLMTLTHVITRKVAMSQKVSLPLKQNDNLSDKRLESILESANKELGKNFILIIKRT